MQRRILNLAADRPRAHVRDAERPAASESAAGDIAADAVLKSLLESGKAAFAAGATEAGIDCLRRTVTGFNLVDCGKVGSGRDQFEASLEQARRRCTRETDHYAGMLVKIDASAA